MTEQNAEPDDDGVIDREPPVEEQEPQEAAESPYAEGVEEIPDDAS